ncbi:Phage integrase family protein [Tenacibaculum maritimum]|uniref:site-specific integrase n=1 Tax=Tenacibaculum maritimum TaxID=107401 RepID=UPI0012E5781A|nr:site-specific integrase [Tenacibaculum maritimum]CAA0248773.1 Phage integrase family protein [Tenacibaculum maritimum]
MSNLVLQSTHGVIRFSLKESIKSLELTPKKESLIMLHFSSKGRRFKKSIGYKCSLKNWDVTKQRVKTGKGMVANAYEVNAFISDIQSYAEEELTKIKKESDFIDVKLLSFLIEKKIKGEEETDREEEKNKELIYYSRKVLEQKKSQIKIVTTRSCNQTIKMLEKYEKSSGHLLRFDDVDLSFYRGFVQFLENEGYSLNSVGKHIKNLKVFLNDALTNGVTDNSIFKSRSFKVLKETTTEIFLTKEELEILANEDFSKRSKLELARDIFLIGCYTGQRVSDYNGLTNENIEVIKGRKVIKIHQKKTGTIVRIPITSKIQKIMERYNGGFPPKLSEPILRENIKLACKKAGFKELITVSYTKGGGLVREGVPKYDLVKTHTARRTFCTNHYIDQKPIQNIMLFSGHKTEREFLKYVRIEKREEALIVMESGFFD